MAMPMGGRALSKLQRVPRYRMNRLSGVAPRAIDQNVNFQISRFVGSYCRRLLGVPRWDKNAIRDRTRLTGEHFYIDRLCLLPPECRQAGVGGYLFGERTVVSVRRNDLMLAKMGDNDVIEVDDLEGCMVFIGEGTQSGQKTTLVGHVENEEYFGWLLNILRWEQQNNGLSLQKGSVYFVSANGDQKIVKIAEQRRAGTEALLTAANLSFPVSFSTYGISFGVIKEAKDAKDVFVNRAVFLVSSDKLAIVSDFNKGSYRALSTGFSGVTFQAFHDSGEAYSGIRLQELKRR